MSCLSVSRADSNSLTNNSTEHRNNRTNSSIAPSKHKGEVSYPRGLGGGPSGGPLVGVEDSMDVGEGTDMLLSLSIDMSRLLSFI